MSFTAIKESMFNYGVQGKFLFVNIADKKVSTVKLVGSGIPKYW